MELQAKIIRAPNCSLRLRECAPQEKHALNVSPVKRLLRGAASIVVFWRGPFELVN